MAIKISSIPEDSLNAVRQHCTSRLETMRAYRLSWWAHWAQLAEMFLPRRYRWFVQPNTYNRGSPMNQSIVDETGVLCARILSTGMLSGLTSPTQPWFQMGILGEDELPQGAVQVWLSEITNRMLSVLAGSNFYTARGTALHDNVVFGSAAMIQYEDPENVVHFYNPCLGEFMFGLSNTLDVDTLYREYTYTVSEAVKEFGLEALSPGTQQMARTAANLDTEIVICHAIEPNDIIYSGGQPIPPIVPRRFSFREVYWEQTSASGQRGGFILRIAGFHESPISGFRWDVTSNDAYGRSPGMDALPAVRQLQIEQRRKAEAIDKMVRPPMVASVSMKNEPMDILPGGVSFVADPAAAGFKPAYTVEPRIGEMMEDLKEVQARVGRVFFNDLFLGISQLGTVRTATEITARQQETLVQIGPVIERDLSELEKIINRLYAIMTRRGMFPPPPPEISGKTLVPTYTSMFAETQRAAATTAIERFLTLAGNLVGVQPDIMDNVDTDKALDIYGNKLNLPPEIMRAVKEVMALRAARAKSQQDAQALEATPGLAASAKNLSQTNVGGGKSALQMMLGNGQ